MKKKDLKWEEIKPNDKCDFEKTYKHMLRNLNHLKNDILQLAATHKAVSKNINK